MMEALLNSSFDWNGIREPLIVATENDHLNGLAMLLGKLVRPRRALPTSHLLEPEAIERVPVGSPTAWPPTA